MFKIKRSLLILPLNLISIPRFLANLRLSLLIHVEFCLTLRFLTVVNASKSHREVTR